MATLTGGTAAEKLNNAIVQLDWVAGQATSVSAGVKTAIHDLATNWVAFFRGDYWNLPDFAQQSKLQRYVEWYTRGYMLLDPGLRVGLVSPPLIDISFAALAASTMARIVDANQAAGTAATELAKEVASGVSSTALLLAAGAIIALYFVAQQK